MKGERIMTDKEIEIVKEAMLNPGKRFEVKREDIEAKIQYFKDIGCTLFITKGKPFIDYDV